MGLDVGDLATDLGGGPGLGPSPSFSLMAGDSIEVNEANISQHFYNTTDWTNSYVSCIFMLSEINIKVRILFQHDLSLQTTSNSTSGSIDPCTLFSTISLSSSIMNN